MKVQITTDLAKGQRDMFALQERDMTELREMLRETLSTGRGRDDAVREVKGLSPVEAADKLESIREVGAIDKTTIIYIYS